MTTNALLIPKRIWLEKSTDSSICDSCDVIVEAEDGGFYTAAFVTPSYLTRQMDLSYEMGKGLPDTPTVRYATIETPHVVVSDLRADTIEDTIDNLLALDTFGLIFTRVTEEEEDDRRGALRTAKRATAEVAAVVFSEVLLIEPDR